MSKDKKHKNSLYCLLLCLFVFNLSDAEIYELPHNDNNIIGNISEVIASHEDTLLDIAQRHGLGFEEIKRANPNIDLWIPGEGTKVILPKKFILPDAPRSGLVLNIAEYRMYYYPETVRGQPEIVITYPMSIGRVDWETPLGKTKVISKKENPSWYPPASIRAERAMEGEFLPNIIPPGPDNPLGDFAIRLDIPGYLIHGTNKPNGIGMRVTHGCIRMLPQNIEELYSMMSLNDDVYIVNQPIKLGWNSDELFIEAHEFLLDNSIDYELHDRSMSQKKAKSLSYIFSELTERYIKITDKKKAKLDWRVAELASIRADGIPIFVGAKN
jgi:L,D-transpeptidase ErfK/SrfK